MSFHFQPQADSSDDEQPAVNLAAWKAGSTRTKKLAPFAEAAAQAPTPPEAPTDGQLPTTLSDNDHDTPFDVSGGQAEKKRKRTPPRADTTPKPVPVVVGGFTSINRPVAQSGRHGDSDDDRDRASVVEVHSPGNQGKAVERGQPKLVAVIPRVRLEPDEIVDLTTGDEVVRCVLEELVDDNGAVSYRVEFEDYSVEEIPFDGLTEYTNGAEALEKFTREGPPEDTSQPTTRRKKMSSTRPSARATRNDGFVSTIDAIPLSDEESSSDDDIVVAGKHKPHHSQYVDNEDGEDDDDDEDMEEEPSQQQSGMRLRLRNGDTTAAARSLRSARRAPEMVELEEADDGSSSDDLPYLMSDLPGTRKRRRKLRTRDQGHADYVEDGIGFERSKRQRLGMRQSERAGRHRGNMQEKDIDDIFRSDSDDGTRTPAKPKMLVAKEVFKPLSRDNEFRMRHVHECETCGQGPHFAPLVYCQGCTLAYHKSCLGNRGSREHLVTKVGDDDFVLQCRRCVAFARRKDPTAPDQGKCQDCHQHGHACSPFRPRKTTMQEQKDRDDNNGQDPIYEVDASRLNNADNVLFRCLNCWRAFHFEHLPPRSDIMDLDTDVDVEQRFREYSRDWKCKECAHMPAKVSGLIAWKPMDEDTYDPALSFNMIDEDEKVYLVKWEGMSYFRAEWMPGAWVWGVTAAAMRKAFGKRDDAQHPKMRTEDAIPEDFLRTDIVLDIRFTSIVEIRTEEVDKARIREIDKALIKYKGLGYEDAVWEAPPSPEDGERWTDFVVAYNDWVLGRYVRPPKAGTLKTKLDKARASQDFSKLEKKTQPENLVGGELMKYQIEGLNWLYYKWFTQKNAILADEMGLGKTIQIIGFLATLVQDWNCFPFLIVVPNSTVPNWRREIKRWAPSLRVVAYYGSKESRDLAYRYELFPEGSKDLRCHVVVTSYDAAGDENCRKFFRSVNWQGLIVDEGQRLKNDKNLLYAALGAMKAPFKILLTGTPLQNNQRELFNLLHFLDEKYNAAELEQRYAELDQDKITELHDLIRPFFLRRTKAQVLTFLPPMAQIIVPVSMTIVQKKLYRTILAKNPDLMKAIFSTDSTLKQAERSSLSNILMQLRKCLCHPFVYNKSIEERNVSISASHRNLVDASSKLKLLELLLPKLRERGHRVLIFSQFLDMLDIVEDFLDGMTMPYQRLDGQISSLVKQKRIDEFNAPDSPLFAFLLSTRAGGVGINLASADTVIILDPDFNPHQDIQALSRAHRIGQNKKVLCFQLVTRASAEERIMQMGRKKLALDHVLIQEMDADDANENDLVSVLRHGASELFEDSGEQDIVYDSASVDRLLDRSHMEDTECGEDKSAETQFSVARVWANDQGALQDAAMVESEKHAPDSGVWANILKERERAAAEEARLKAEAFGRGRRARGHVDYANDKAPEGAEGLEFSPVKDRKMTEMDESDTDFQAEESGDDEPYEGDGEALETGEMADFEDGGTKRDAGRKKNAYPTFRRAVVPQPEQAINHGLPTPPDTTQANGAPTPIGPPYPTPARSGIHCLACRTFHPIGACPLKLAGVEHCNLCGMAHFGMARVCPHIQSETQVRAMLEALKYSNEPEHLVAEARRYLRGLKGSLVQSKKQKELKEHAVKEAELAARFQSATAPFWSGQSGH